MIICLPAYLSSFSSFITAVDSDSIVYCRCRLLHLFHNWLANLLLTTVRVGDTLRLNWTSVDHGLLLLCDSWLLVRHHLGLIRGHHLTIGASLDVDNLLLRQGLWVVSIRVLACRNHRCTMLLMMLLELSLALSSEVSDHIDDDDDHTNAACDWKHDVNEDDHPDTWTVIVIIRIKFLNLGNSLDLPLIEALEHTAGSAIVCALMILLSFPLLKSVGACTEHRQGR